MQFGVMLPHRWLYAAGNTIADFASEAEALGYTSLWVTDHIIVPSYRTERGHIFYEALTTLAYVSSLAPRCRLGVAVLALPPRNAVLVAKQVATLDALSQGRVLLGVGTGWIEEELRYLGAAWQQRGPMLDEAIQVLRALWSDEGANSFAGRYTTFRGYPKSKYCANIRQSRMLPYFHRGLPHGCPNSQTISDRPNRRTMGRLAAAAASSQARWTPA